MLSNALREYLQNNDRNSVLQAIPSPNTSSHSLPSLPPNRTARGRVADGRGLPRGGGKSKARGTRTQEAANLGNAQPTQESESVRRRSARGSAASRRTGRNNASDDQSSVASKNCHCGINAAQKTVIKEGPNKGRKFWTCSKPMSDPQRCTFFEWS
ncbi:hypothetical protein AB6A40_003507 [Gnathostoma spinigerum]|uniref:GRF-type domain-containing protein n=1 Tax=Gnathostoma spinigerum TaxID=75299 RepID=A0ABD6EIK9_9BILA